MLPIFEGLTVVAGGCAECIVRHRPGATARVAKTLVAGESTEALVAVCTQIALVQGRKGNRGDLRSIVQWSHLRTSFALVRILCKIFARVDWCY